MTSLLYCFESNHPLNESLLQIPEMALGTIHMHHFPDEETLVRFDDRLVDRSVIFHCPLNKPNQKIVPLLFAAETARALGAKKIGLCAPYLAYMRQDKIFHQGEGETASYFAKLLSQYFDWIVTVEPHLHRHQLLDEIYTIPNRVVRATAAIAKWISSQVPDPCLIGPDRESEQWVALIAKELNAPYAVFDKVRHGDRAVEMVAPELSAFIHHTPVLIDDIVSSGGTLMKACDLLQTLGHKKPYCIVVHPLFIDDSYQQLSLRFQRVVSCNTLLHASNAIDISSAVGTSIAEMAMSESLTL